MRSFAVILAAALIAASASSASEYEGLPVVEVEFSPRAQPLAAEALSNLVSVKPGAPLDDRQIRDTIGALFATGRYANIEVRAERVEEGARLFIRTEPNWFIGDVVVIGVAEPPNQNQLVNATRLRLGQLYTEQAAATARQNLRRLLVENGFTQPLIEYDTVRRDEDYQVDITFRMTPVSRAQIGDMVLPSSAPMSEKEVRSIADWKRGKQLTEERIEEGLGKLRKELHERDYWQGEATLTGRDYNPDNNQTNLIVNIQTGPKVIVRLEGFSLSQKDLERLLPIYEEGAVDEDLLAEGARNLSDYLETRGYFDASVEYERRRSGEDGVEVVYTIERGPRRKLSSITITGELFFDEQTIRERMLMQEASLQLRRGRFSSRLLQRDIDAITNLYRSNGFRDAEVSPIVRNLGDKKIAVHLHIEEGEATFIDELSVVGMDRFPLDNYRFASAEGQPFSETSAGQTSPSG